MSDSDEPVILYTPKRVSKSMENCRKRLHSSSLTAKQRALKAGNEDFFAEDEKLFCRICCKVVDHTRQGSLDRHKLSEAHKNNKNRNLKQKTLKTTLSISTNVKLENVALINSWVRSCAAANIPLFATNNTILLVNCSIKS